MDNLLKETEIYIEMWGKKVTDVKWVGSEDYGWFTWEDFKELANVDYDDGFGAQEVAKDLLVVGEDWWLERHEYDGSEWWELKELPVKPDEYKKPNMLIGGMWKNLGELND